MREISKTARMLCQNCQEITDHDDHVVFDAQNHVLYESCTCKTCGEIYGNSDDPLPRGRAIEKFLPNFTANITA